MLRCKRVEFHSLELVHPRGERKISEASTLRFASASKTLISLRCSRAKGKRGRAGGGVSRSVYQFIPVAGLAFTYQSLYWCFAHGVSCLIITCLLIISICDPTFRERAETVSMSSTSSVQHHGCGDHTLEPCICYPRLLKDSSLPSTNGKFSYVNLFFDMGSPHGFFFFKVGSQLMILLL